MNITSRVQIKDNMSKNCCLLLAIALSGKMNAIEAAYIQCSEQLRFGIKLA